METFVNWHQQRKISPIRPLRLFQAEQIVEAFRYMQAGTHIGKIVVEVPSDATQLPTTNVKITVSFRPNASYLLVGGLGGVGKSISTWMAEEGARELVFLSRTAGRSIEDETFIRELEAQDCRVICVQGSVAEVADVKRAVAACTLPLVGVLQMAVSLQV